MHKKCCYLSICIHPMLRSHHTWEHIAINIMSKHWQPVTLSTAHEITLYNIIKTIHGLIYADINFTPATTVAHKMIFTRYYNRESTSMV